MDDVGGKKQAQQIGMIIGILAAFLILRRLRKRRKEKKLIKARAKARVRLQEQRRKEEEAGSKTRKKAAKKGKKGKKERSLVEQLIRFAVFQFLKKVISEQIKRMEVDLGGSKLGKKVVEAAEPSAS